MLLQARPHIDTFSWYNFIAHIWSYKHQITLNFMNSKFPTTKNNHTTKHRIPNSYKGKHSMQPNLSNQQLMWKTKVFHGIPNSLPITHCKCKVPVIQFYPCPSQSPWILIPHPLLWKKATIAKYSGPPPCFQLTTTTRWRFVQVPLWRFCSMVTTRLR